MPPEREGGRRHQYRETASLSEGHGDDVRCTLIVLALSYGVFALAIGVVTSRLDAPGARTRGRCGVSLRINSPEAAGHRRGRTGAPLGATARTHPIATPHQSITPIHVNAFTEGSVRASTRLTSPTMTAKTAMTS